MKIMGNVLTYLLITAALLAFGCVNEPGNPNKPVVPVSKYSGEFLGEWIRMDTGERWYINGDSIKVNDSAFNGNVTLSRNKVNGVWGQVITVKETGSHDYFLFASRIANGSFSSRLVMIDGETGNRSAKNRAAIPSGGIKIKPPLNPGLEQIVYPDPVTGVMAVTGIIPGDPVEITPVNSNWNDVNVELSPWDGQDVGIIPLAKGANLKTSIRMANPDDDITMLYADGIIRNFVIETENIGTTNITGVDYKLILTDEKNDINFNRDFASYSGITEGLWNTIRPGEKREIALSLGAAPIEDGQRNKKIGIRLVSYDTELLKTRIWEDSVSLKYNKVQVPFRFRSEEPVQGVIKAPNGKTFYFKTEGIEGSYSYSIDVPWSSEDYFIAFLGASVDTGSETRYSLAINDTAPSNWSSLIGTDRFLYEPANDNENTATNLDMKFNKTFMGYLHDGDIDYYRVNLGNIPPESRIVDMEDWGIGETEGNYPNGKVNPGDIFNLDIMFKNNSNDNKIITITGLSADNTYAPYFDFIRLPSYQLHLQTNHYGTLTANNTDTVSTGVQLLNNSNIERTLCFRLLPGAPAGTMKLTITFNDNIGIKYNKEIVLDVIALVKEDITISFANFIDINPVITAGIIYIVGNAEKPISANITLNNSRQYDAGSIKWYFNGTRIEADVSGGYGEKLNINSGVYNRVGFYSVIVEAKINGKLYSKIITFEVRL